MDLTKEGVPICSLNPCASQGMDFVKFKGICTEIGKPNENICEKFYVVDFIPKQRKPQCILTQKIISGVGILPCKAGSAIMIHGKCHVSDWDFGKEDD